MSSILGTLEGLEDDAARTRVLAWVSQRLAISHSAPLQPGGSQVSRDTSNSVDDSATEFPTFADLFNAIAPTSNAEKALAAAYWLQVCSGQDQFTSQTANRELQDLGHALVNITDAFRQLQNKKPALAIQIKKSGKSQQARKLFKLTRAGIDAVSGRLT